MLSNPWRIARVLLSVHYAQMMEYRAELYLWVLSGTLPLILMGIWIQASQGGQFGLSPTDFARYFLAVFIVRQFTVVWVMWDFETEIVEGKLSLRLLQPLDPFWHHFSGHFAERFARMPFVLGLIALFFWLYPQAIWMPTLGQWLLFLPAILLAFALRFLVQYTLALLAFWVERATALEQFWFLPYLFLSGMIAPIEVFPPGLQAIVGWLPFPYLIYFPATLITGHPAAWEIAKGFVVILAWLLGFGVLNRWLWRRGLKQYSGMGA